MTIRTKLPQNFHCRPHAAAALHLLVLGVALAMASSAARAQDVLMPCCNLLQGVNLVPCLAMASGGAAAGGRGVVNISGTCCSSLNQALDAGRRCLCSLLLSNGVLAGLVATLIPTLPLVLPLPGCYLYAPPLAACPVRILQTNGLPATASAAETIEAAAAAASGGVEPPPPHQAATMPPLKSSSNATGQKADGRTNGTLAPNGPIKVREEERVSRSSACRRPGAGDKMTYKLMFAVVMAVFWFNFTRPIHDFITLINRYDRHI